MAVLMIGEVPNLTAEMYGSMLEQLKPTMESAAGFIAHSGGPHPDGGWRVVEMWESEEESEQWFNQNVRPNLPPEIVPKRTYSPLLTAFTA
jgi:heme-degrading monooxygenase HmoA